MNEIIEKIRLTLSEKADEKTRIGSRRYFKEEIAVYGVKSDQLRQISKQYFQEIKNYSKPEIFDLCENLWKSEFLEEKFIASDWAENLKKRFEPADFEIFEHWIKNYINNWASCDSFCNHAVGDFVMMYPEYIAKLKEFAHSENRWVKRAAAVSLIIPARKGLFLNDIFEIADILLTDKDDMVQKGYGWMLKAASQSDQQSVFEYVIKNKTVMPRTALRYAIEKMPDELKKRAIIK